MVLPNMLYTDGIRKYTDVKFGGYDHTHSGGIYDMENMSSDAYPLLAPRAKRYKLRQLEKPNGFYANDGLYWADGTGFYADGTLKGIVEDSEKTFACIGAYIIILPDKRYYNRLTGEFGTLEASRSGSVKIQDGTYAGEAAAANTIYGEGISWSMYFKAGDAVEISGCIRHTENNKTAVIREVDGEYLRFYENCFVISDGGDAEDVTLARRVPDLSFICENENRLWGCSGDTIYASALGDPFNWNVFDGLSTDSYAADVGSAGDFTGCISYLGYPCFFKEEYIYKVYGSKPSNFQIMGSASLGVERGSGKSLAIAGETLFYLSRAGVAAYTGGMPQNISAAFGNMRYKNAVGGSDGQKYYISMEDAAGKTSLFVFDTAVSLWHREDSTKAVAFGWERELYFLDDGGGLWLGSAAEQIPEGAAAEADIASMVEFGDFTESLADRKGVSKLQLRAELMEDAQLTVEMQFDSDGQWHDVAVLKTVGKRSFYLPIVPRRCDHFRLRLRGSGEYVVHSLSRESYEGSALR